MATTTAIGSTVKLSRPRKLIARRMRNSLQVSAQLTAVQEVDLTRIAKLRDRVKASFRQKKDLSPTYLPFFARATVPTLKEFPQFNASLDEAAGESTYHPLCPSGHRG